jgi:hypothetical protein
MRIKRCLPLEVAVAVPSRLSQDKPAAEKGARALALWPVNPSHPRHEASEILP